MQAVARPLSILDLTLWTSKTSLLEDLSLCFLITCYVSIQLVSKRHCNKFSRQWGLRSPNSTYWKGFSFLTTQNKVEEKPILPCVPRVCSVVSIEAYVKDDIDTSRWSPPCACNVLCCFSIIACFLVWAPCRNFVEWWACFAQLTLIFFTIYPITPWTKDTLMSLLVISSLPITLLYGSKIVLQS